MISESNIIKQEKLVLIKSIAFCLEIPFFHSGNAMYRIQRSSSGKVWGRKELKVYELQGLIKTQITSIKIKSPEEVFCYSMHVAFVFSKLDWVTKNNLSLRKIDLTNLLKPIEDAITEGIGIDDSKNVYSIQSKCLLPSEFKTPPFYVAVDFSFFRKE
jgi:Holliday junction resolvase RusA-like endonuclease